MPEQPQASGSDQAPAHTSEKANGASVTNGQHSSNGVSKPGGRHIYPMSAGWDKGPNMETFELILERVSHGETLKAVARDLGLDEGSLRYHISKDKKLFTRYAVARELQAEAWSDEIVRISDEADEAIVGDDKSDNARVAAKRLRYDARRWLMSKLHPKKYGDRLELDGGLHNTNKTMSVVVQVFENSPAAVRAMQRELEKGPADFSLTNGNGNGEGEHPKVDEEIADG